MNAHRFVNAVPFALAALACVAPALAAAQSYPVRPAELPEAKEIALALSAAPNEVSGRADVYVLRGTDFVKVRSGTNGCACMVARDLHEGSLYPICFDQEAARTVMLREMKESSLRAKGLSEAEIETKIATALTNGQLPKASKPALAYMMSSQQVLFSSAKADGFRVGAWYPHVMMTGVQVTPDQLGLLPNSKYPIVQAGGEPGSLHELVVIVAAWSDGTPAPAQRQSR